MLHALLLAACHGPAAEPACPPPPVRPGTVRVRRLGCEADLPTGAFAAARVGDWVLENGTSRWVVRDGPEGHALVGLTGGNLVDAVRVSGGVQQGGDGLRELGATVGFHVLAPDAFTPGDGSLEVTGTLQPFPLVTDVLQLGRPATEVRWEYVVDPWAPVLEVRAHLQGEAASLSEVWLVRGGQQLLVPGTDPWDPPLTSDAASLGVLTPDPELGPALATSADTPRDLLFAGPIRVVLYEPVAGTVTRRIALGADHAEASGWLDPTLELWDNEQGLVEIRDAAGRPVSRCRGTRCAVPDEAVELVPSWIGDGNGGPGGPGQEGAPAELRITAPGAFRATAVREDGLHRTLVDLDGDGTFLLPPGTWEVTVGAGPTATRHTETVTLPATVEADLRHVVDTTGWSGADLHVHMETSLDSDIPSGWRLAAALAEGLDYVVTTDHDFVGDPDVPEGLVVRASAEVSTMKAGHFNAWPVQPDPDAAGNGAPDWRGLEVEALVEALPGLVQCNHPRFVDGGYAASFDIGLDPARCDLVEVLNGFSLAETPQVLDDLLAAWSTGARPVATGASDCHYDDDPEGTPRTWVRAEGDADVLDEALRAGHAVASGGPFVTLTVDGAAIGESVTVSGTATASVTLQAPDWMPLGELVLVVDGAEVFRDDLSGLPAAGGLRRYENEVEVSPTAFVMVVHRGSADVVTNPVWIR